MLHGKLMQHITKEFITQFLPENPIVLEAGAHIGRDTVKLAKLWPHGIIHAFEPIPILFEQLRKITARFTNIQCYQYALSNKSGITSIYESTGIDTLSSMLQPTDYFTSNSIISFNQIEVPTVTIDSWAQQNHISAIDFMWLDLQGYELEVLKASPTILETAQVILTEVSTIERYKNNPLYYEVRAWLEQQSFKMIQEDFFKKTWGNVLFVRK